jgi:hypothetical protein
MAQPNNFGYGDDFSGSDTGSESGSGYEDETGNSAAAATVVTESDRNATARAILQQAALFARASTERALAALDRLVADAPVDGFADWLANSLQPGAELSSDIFIAAFVRGIAAGGGAPAGRVAAIQRDALTVCFLGNALIVPVLRPNNEPIQTHTFEHNIGI